MELWIRSQDRKDLICTRRIYVHENTIRTNIYEAIGFAILGEYETKERALDVLDTIQNKLKYGMQVTNNNQIVGTTTYVYQMPEK
mgnify:CR=1 FL=1